MYYRSRRMQAASVCHRPESVQDVEDIHSCLVDKADEAHNLMNTARYSVTGQTDRDTRHTAGPACFFSRVPEAMKVFRVR
jgi:hypothetical protein